MESNGFHHVPFCAARPVLETWALARMVTYIMRETLAM
jgi:hypothetical protein